MKKFKREEIVDGLTNHGFVPQHAKGAHTKYVHQDFPWLVVTLALGNEASENVYKESVDALALLERLTSTPLKNKKLSEKMLQDIRVRRKRTDVKTLFSSEMIKAIRADNLDDFFRLERTRYATVINSKKGGKTK